MKRIHQILLGMLVVQVVIAVAVLWPRAAATEPVELLLPEVSADEIVALTIVDDQAQEIVLRKTEGTWVLPEAGNYPAQAETITPLLEKLASLATETVVARTAASHRQLQVAEEDFVRRVDFETADGEAHTIYLGSAPRYTATHVRVGSESETYLTTELSTWELNTRANSWIDTAYTSIDQATLETVTLENAQGTFAFVKKGEEWTLADPGDDEEVSAGEINTIIRNASAMNILRPLGKTEELSYGLDEPAAQVILMTDDGTTHVIRVGAQDSDDHSYVVKYDGSPYYVRVAEFAVQAIVENDRESFLVQSTPEAEDQPLPSDATSP